MSIKTWKMACLASLMGFCFASCDDSQTVSKDDTKTADSEIEVLINEISKGTVDPYADETLYEEVDLDGSGTKTKLIAISTLIQKALGIEAKDLKNYLNKYTCNYESGQDGFRPSSKGEKCAPISCSYATVSYVDVSTGNLVYQKSEVLKGPHFEGMTEMPGCYSVKQLSKVLMTEINEAAKKFSIYIDGQNMGSYDLSTLTNIIVEKDGKKFILINDILTKTLGRTADDIARYQCDFVDGTDKAMSSDMKCPVRSCTDVAKGYIEVESLNVTDSEAAKTAACYEMADAGQLRLNKPETDEPFNVEVYIDDKLVKKIDAKLLKDKIKGDAGDKYVLASDIIEAAKAGTKLSDYQCNYLGNDPDRGEYDPTAKSACAELKSCTYAETAHVYIVSQNMDMTDKSMPSCFNVSNIYKIKLYTNKTDGGDGGKDEENTQDAYNVKVIVDGSEKTVDISKLTDKIKTGNGGEKTMNVGDIILAAVPDIDLAKYTCDYASNAGSSPYIASEKGCTVQSCSHAADMNMSLTNKKIFGESNGKCNVKDFDTILVTKAE